MTWPHPDNPEKLKGTLFPKRELAPHRALRCVRCSTLVDVLEIPAGHLDELRYVCSWCLAMRALDKREKREGQPAAVPYNEFPEGF
jgi:hypothetical protein